MAQAVYRINDYIIYKIPTLLGYSGSGIKPIFPTQEVPESNSINGPFLVYNYATSPGGAEEEWWVNIDQVNYIIYSTDVEESTSIIEALNDEFRRMDESATDINKYLKSVNKNDFNFYYTRVMTQLSPETIVQEGGRHGRLLTLRYKYAKTSGTGIS